MKSKQNMKMMIIQCKIFKSIALVFCLSLGLVSCSSEDDSDDLELTSWPYATFVFNVCDKNGNSIVEKDMGLTVTYKGNTYPIKEYKSIESTNGEVNSIYSRDIIYGLYMANGLYQDSNSLCFGALYCGRDIDENIVLTWKDGFQNIIHISLTNHKIENGHMFFDTNIKLDGIEHTEELADHSHFFIFSFVKE